MEYRALGQMIARCDRITYLFQKQDYLNGLQEHQNGIGSLSGLLHGNYSEYLKQSVSQSAAWLLQYQETQDYIGMADVYNMHIREACVRERARLNQEEIWLPVEDFYADNYEAANEQIRAMLDSLQAETEDISDQYQLVENMVGEFSLGVCQDASKQNFILLSGRNNPYMDAQNWIDTYQTQGENESEYVLFGLEMGYTASVLAQQEDICRIRVYEADASVIKAAFHYRNLTDLLRRDIDLEIWYDAQLVDFAQALSECPSSGMIHHPSVKNITNEHMKMMLENLFMQQNSILSQKRMLQGNFRRNMSHKQWMRCRSLQELTAVFRGKKVLFMAGGPSLEKYLVFLQKCNTDYTVTVYEPNQMQSYKLSEVQSQSDEDDYIIVCVGTVLTQLISYGITPDYVVMTDAQDNMISQVAGVDTTDLKLICIPTLYYQVLQYWQGEIYVGMQQGFDLAEHFAAEHGYVLYQSGGSVATFALDFLLRVECDCIICMGLDLAFVQNRTHAGSGRKIIQQEGLRQVWSVYNDRIYTSKNLDNYRLWIERRLADRSQKERKTRVINVSDGAWIEGMEHEPDWIDQWD